MIAKVDNKAVVDSWTLSGGVAGDLNNILKELFLSVVKLNIWLNMIYVPSSLNLADAPSRSIEKQHCMLSGWAWSKVQKAFGEGRGHTFDLMALQSNVQHDLQGVPLPFYSPYP